ncbi:hypothetical protein [Helicobacter pylori]|uniref:hypothetical protein n=1 Tax=Helicobacter pylori TaxID=210 RepID=UPI000EB1A47B|nr:hypothetical protein [Helicobacter pylori]RKV53640.1 hypothetical protein DD775_08160 [Helicobacter pylori]
MAFYHSIILSFYHSIILSFNHSSNQAIKQSSNQALFINPFINLHRNIFKPFDSISPIFKSVGLTELNSIQGEDDGSVRRFKST